MHSPLSETLEWKTSSKLQDSATALPKLLFHHCLYPIWHDTRLSIVTTEIQSCQHRVERSKRLQQRARLCAPQTCIERMALLPHLLTKALLTDATALSLPLLKISCYGPHAASGYHCTCDILIPTGFDNNYAAAEPAKWT